MGLMASAHAAGAACRRAVERRCAGCGSYLVGRAKQVSSTLAWWPRLSRLSADCLAGRMIDLAEGSVRFPIVRFGFIVRAVASALERAIGALRLANEGASVTVLGRGTPQPAVLACCRGSVGGHEGVLSAGLWCWKSSARRRQDWVVRLPDAVAAVSRCSHSWQQRPTRCAGRRMFRGHRRNGLRPFPVVRRRIAQGFGIVRRTRACRDQR